MQSCVWENEKQSLVQLNFTTMPKKVAVDYALTGTYQKPVKKSSINALKRGNG